LADSGILSVVINDQADEDGNRGCMFGDLFAARDVEVPKAGKDHTGSGVPTGNTQSVSCNALPRTYNFRVSEARNKIYASTQARSISLVLSLGTRRRGGGRLAAILILSSTSEGPSTFNEIVDNWTSSLRFIQSHRYTPTPVKEFVGELLEYDESTECRSLRKACKRKFHAYILASTSGAAVTMTEIAHGYEDRYEKLVASDSLNRDDEHVDDDEVEGTRRKKGQGELNKKRSESERTPLTDLTNVGVVGLNSVIATQPPSITDIRGWSTEQLIGHLQAKFSDDLDDEDLENLQKQKIKGHGMKRGPASVIAGYIDELKGTWHSTLFIERPRERSSTHRKRKNENEGNDESEPRKKMPQDLENLPSPTDYAKASGPKSCTKENGPPLYNHRNPVLPFSFDTFLRRLNGIEGEVDEENELNGKNSSFDSCDSSACLWFAACDNMKTDGTFFTTGECQFLVCNLEFAVRLANENAVIAERTCFPTFLILLEGTYLSICGAVFSDAVCIDRLTTVIPLEKAAYDTATLDYIVRTLRALVRCIKDLELHYKDIMELVDIPKTITNGAQPRSLSVGTELELHYHKRLMMKGKRLWIAYMKTESQDEERKVVVKFARQYSIKMHLRMVSEL
ncbi:9434_t:CDS:10, partial [Paraglomus brasilianum]